MNSIIVAEIHIYPIKSCRGIALEQAEIAPKGFLWDREMMIVDRAGKFLTQRQYPQLATVKVEIQEDRITLSTSEQFLEPIAFQPSLEGQSIDVVIWNDRTKAILQDPLVSEWFTTLLKSPCHLVRQSPKQIRAIDPKYAPRDNLPVSFSDGYPFLLTNTASLAELNKRLEETYQNEEQTLPMARFRPNIVIQTEDPFIEDRWKKITIGTIQLAVVKPCTRCIITTTDQITGVRNPLQEPLKTLNSFRKSAKGVLFGQNLIPLHSGVIRLGDSVTILE
jgi:hypothetical protein